MEVTMTRIIGTTTKRQLSVKLVGGIAISALLALGAFATPASADWDNDHRGYHHNWNGGYYNAPPVVYGSPYGGGYFGGGVWGGGISLRPLPIPRPLSLLPR